MSERVPELEPVLVRISTNSPLTEAMPTSSRDQWSDHRPAEAEYWFEKPLVDLLVMLKSATDQEKVIKSWFNYRENVRAYLAATSGPMTRGYLTTIEHKHTDLFAGEPTEVWGLVSRVFTGG